MISCALRSNSVTVITDTSDVSLMRLIRLFDRPYLPRAGGDFSEDDSRQAIDIFAIDCLLPDEGESGGQSLRAFGDERRAAIDKARVELHQRGAGSQFGARVVAGENAADADDRHRFADFGAQL